MWCLIWLALILPFDKSTDTVFFQSESIRDLELKPWGMTRTILDDHLDTIEVESFTDRNGVLYWHRKLHTPVCQTGECKEIDVGIYWKSSGDFMGLEVYKEHLTRTDHSIFSEEDYQLLIEVMMNDWSILREYEYDDLLTESSYESDGSDEADAVTGATRKEISDETVADAVYTTYTLWHLIHVGEKEQLRLRTAELINNDKSLLDRLIHSSDLHDSRLILELFAEGKLLYSPSIAALIIQSLASHKDNIQRELALKAISKLDFGEVGIQDQMATIYMKLKPNEKIRVLNYMGIPQNLSAALYQALIANLTAEDEWLAGRTLNTVKAFPNHNPETVKLAQDLSKSQNTFTRQAARDFLDFIEEKGE